MNKLLAAEKISDSYTNTNMSKNERGRATCCVYDKNLKRIIRPSVPGEKHAKYPSVQIKSGQIPANLGLKSIEILEYPQLHNKLIYLIKTLYIFRAM